MYSELSLPSIINGTATAIATYNNNVKRKALKKRGKGDVELKLDDKRHG